MAGERRSEEIRSHVLKLGAAGKTYAEIQAHYPIPKSTLSYWFKHSGRKRKRNRAERLKILKRARAAARITIRDKRLARLSEAENQARRAVENLDLTSVAVQKALLSMLYWAEGTKSDRASLIFTNTDPVLVSLYLKLLRASFAVDESKLRIRLHLHHYHKHDDARRFWSGLLQVPESLFGKIYVKKRSVRKKFRRNFQGICFVVYHDVAVRREIMALGEILSTQLKHKLS
jgi:hypothetical protein